MNQNENLEKIQTIVKVVIWQKMRINKSKSLDSIVMMHSFISSLFRVSVFSEEEPDLNNELEISVRFLNIIL